VDINQFLANLLDLFAANSTFGVMVGGAGFLSYIIGAIFLGRIYKKAGQPPIAAFVPVWNIIVFFRLGGYSSLWIVGAFISYAYIGGSMLTSAAQLTGAEWAQEGAAKAVIAAMPVAIPIVGFLLVATTLIGLLAAYNIGRAFEKDAGYLLLFVFLPVIWLIALAFTSYDWDEDSANPNSIGEMDRSNLRSARLREVAVNREKSARFLDPVAPPSVTSGAVESDYDRALREQESRGGVPAQKTKRVRKGKGDPGDAKIVDAGSTGVDTKSDWF